MRVQNSTLFSSKIRLLALVLSLILATPIAGAADTAGHPTKHGFNDARVNPPSKGLDIPEAEVVQSKLKTADAAFRQMVVSHAFKSSNPRVQGDVDIIQWITDDLLDTIHGKHPDLKNVDLKDVKKAYQFYGFGSDKLMNGIVEALKTDIGQIEIVTDLNLALEGAFKDGQEYNSDWAAAKIKDTEPGRALQKLLEAGCTFGGKGRCQIRGGQPLYNSVAPPGKEAARVPIFHHKDMFTVVMERNKSGKVTGERCVNMKTGTANMNESAPRYNRFFDVIDPDLNQAAYEHHLRVLANSEKGGRIFEMESKAPLKVVYKDGSSIQLASTDGKFELNQAIVDDWKKWAENPKEFQVKRIWGSHFAPTDADMIMAQSDVLKAHPVSTAFWVVDQRFVREWGVPGPMAGITAVRPFGQPLHPYPGSVRFDPQTKKPRIESFVYMRAADGGTVETDRDAAPNGVHLWHDKTTVSKVDNSASQDASETLKSLHFKVNTLSYNASHNFHNAESQFTMQLPEDSWIANGIVESIEKVVELEPQFAIPLYQGIPMENLAILTGHRDVEVSPKDIDGLLAAIKKTDLPATRKILEEVAARPTTLSKKVSPAELQNQLGNLESFVQWLKEQPGGADKIKKFSYNDLNSLLEIIHNGGMSGPHIKGLLGDILWGLNAGNDSQEKKEGVDKLLPDAWKAFGIKKPFETAEPDSHQLRRSVAEVSPGKPGLPVAPLTGTAADAKAASSQLEIALFDWDDTVASLDTKIVVYKTRKDGKPGTASKGLTTREFADIRNKLGKPDGGEWSNYQLTKDSFRNFNDSNFLKDVQKAFNSDPKAAKGPEFANFQKLLQQVADNRKAALQGKPGPALRVGLLSARGVERKQVLQAIQWLLDQGHLKLRGLPDPIQANSLLKSEDIFMMSNPESNPLGLSQEAAKAWALESRAAAAERYYKMHPAAGHPMLWFGDDDPVNVQKVREAIASTIQSSFPDVDVYVKQVSKSAPEQHLYFVKSDGTTDEIEDKVGRLLAADASGTSASKTPGVARHHEATARSVTESASRVRACGGKFATRVRRPRTAPPPP